MVIEPANLSLAIEPANIVLVIPDAFTCKESLLISIEESSTATLSVALDPNSTSPPPVKALPAVYVTESFDNLAFAIEPAN